MKRRSILKIFSLVVLVATFFVFGENTTFSQTKLEEELQQKQSAIKELETQLQKDRARLLEINAEKNTLDRAVRELDQTQSKLGKEVNLTQTRIRETELTIERLNLTISEKEERISNYKKVIEQGIREINENDRIPFVLLALGSENITDFLKETDERNSLHKKLGDTINELTEDKISLLEDKGEKEERKEELVDYKNEVTVEKKLVDQNKKEKDALLNETKNKESEYQKIIDEKTRLRAQFEDELADIQSRIDFELDPNSYPRAKHGIFEWPLDYILITQGFGLTKDSERLYAYRSGQWSGQHTGVDFRANNDKVYAMSDGKVVGFGNTDGTCPRASFGGWMLIQYDNGLSSIYSHLSSFVAKKGDRVKAGTLVAYSGNTGYSTGPHLDVKVVPASAVSIETWPSKGCPGKNYTTPLVANSTYLNPLGYLPKASNDMFK